MTIKTSSGLLEIEDWAWPFRLGGFVFAIFGVFALNGWGTIKSLVGVWIITILGFALMILVPKFKITIKKATNQLIITYHVLFWTTKTTTYSLKDVKEIELAMEYSRSKRGYRLVYTKFAVLNDGKRVNLQYTQGSSNLKRETAEGKQIASFIGVPFTERRPPTVQEALGVMKEEISKKITGSSDEK
jgi:hypothetical protein